jgi:hypothetical protein
MGGAQTAIVSVLDITEHPEFQAFQKSVPVFREPIRAPPLELNKVHYHLNLHFHDIDQLQWVFFQATDLAVAVCRRIQIAVKLIIIFY